MAGLSNIEFFNNDYVINGTPLLRHLAKHEGVTTDHLTAIECEPLALDRLLAKEKPDLSFGFTALYLCGHCGGYDGSPIGVKISVSDETITWDEMGWCTDMGEQDFCSSFNKVSGFTFSKHSYEEFIAQASVYKAKWYA